MIAALALAVSLQATPPKPSWFGTDKVKHFFMSALVQSVTYSMARTAGVERGASQVAAGGAVLAVGIGKEIHDRRRGGPFSTQDIAWDVAGGAAAAALLNGTR